MNIDEIREYCLAFPQATEKLQWGTNLCFKIAGKIFVILDLDNAELCFKCTPETFAELIERPDIRPAPYVGRYNLAEISFQLYGFPSQGLLDVKLLHYSEADLEIQAFARAGKTLQPLPVGTSPSTQLR